MTASELEQILSEFTDEQLAFIAYDWRLWARESQVAPEGDWSYWLFLAGRGSGKTRAGAEWLREIKEHCGRIGLVAPTAADARDVMVEGDSGILATSPPWDRPVYEPSKRKLTWDNGATASLFSAEEPERLRGPQHDAVWCDELAAWKYLRETWDMMQFGLRLGTAPKAMVTTTPKPLPLIRELLKDPATAITRGSTYDNEVNLAPSFFREIIKRYEGTRLGRQELEAEVLDDMPGALWTRAMIENARTDEWPEFLRVVVGVDPSGSDGETGGSQGIVVAGLGVDGLFYVIEDASCKESPREWGKKAVDLLERYEGDLIVAERNYGGAMVQAVIETADENAPVKLVDASRGKHIRAEPISALYEKGRVKHLCISEELDDQLCLMTHEGYEGDGSPDRLDALVWALTELSQAGDQATGVIMKRARWRSWPQGVDIPNCEPIVQCWSLPFGADDDIASCTTWGVFETKAVASDGREYRHAHAILTAAWSGRTTASAFIEEARKQYDDRKPNVVLAEKMAEQTPLFHELRHIGVPLVEWEPTGGSGPGREELRAHAAALLLDQGCVWHPGKKWSEGVVNDCALYPNGPLVGHAASVILMLSYLRRIHLEIPTDEPDEEERQDIEEREWQERKPRRLYGKVTRGQPAA